jgi:hypothetical protein
MALSLQQSKQKMKQEFQELLDQAGIERSNIPLLGLGSVVSGEQMLNIFAELVASKQREKCANLADEYATWGGSNFYSWFKKLANDIRSIK